MSVNRLKYKPITVAVNKTDENIDFFNSLPEKEHYDFRTFKAVKLTDYIEIYSENIVLKDRILTLEDALKTIRYYPHIDTDVFNIANEALNEKGI